MKAVHSVSRTIALYCVLNFVYIIIEAQARSEFQGEVTSPRPAQRAKFQIRGRSSLNCGRSLTLLSKDSLLVKQCLCIAT